MHGENVTLDKINRSLEDITDILKSVASNMATKADLAELREEINEKFATKEDLKDMERRLCQNSQN